MTVWRVSEPVNEQVKTQPDHVNKVPVPGSAFETEVMVGGEVTFDDAEEYDGQHGGAQNHVEAVEASQHVEQRAVGTRVKAQVQVVVGVDVFVGLASDEHKTQNHGRSQPEGCFSTVTGAQCMVREGQCQA